MKIMVSFPDKQVKIMEAREMLFPGPPCLPPPLFPSLYMFLRPPESALQPKGQDLRHNRTGQDQVESAQVPGLWEPENQE